MARLEPYPDAGLKAASERLDPPDAWISLPRLAVLWKTHRAGDDMVMNGATAKKATIW